MEWQADSQYCYYNESTEVLNPHGLAGKHLPPAVHVYASGNIINVQLLYSTFKCCDSIIS